MDANSLRGLALGAAWVAALAGCDARSGACTIAATSPKGVCMVNQYRPGCDTASGTFVPGSLEESRALCHGQGFTEPLFVDSPADLEKALRDGKMVAFAKPGTRPPTPSSSASSSP